MTEPLESQPREVLVFEDAGQNERLLATVLTPAEASASFATRGAPPIPLDAALKAVPDLQRALQGGQVMRVVGGPAGELVTSGNDTLAIARNADGTIAGPLRFDGGPKNVRHVAAPAALFQVAGALTLQHYLDTISSQLEALQQGVQEIKDILLAVEKGELYAAQKFVAQQEQLVAEGIKLGTDLSSAIETHLGNVRAVYSRVRDRLHAQVETASKVIDPTGSITDHDAYDEELLRMRGESHRDAVQLLGAIDLTIRLLRLQQVAAVERALGQAPSLRRTALEEIAELRADFALLGPLFERWIVPDTAIAQHASGVRVHNKFSTTRRILHLRDYQLATAPLRGVLGRSPEELFPVAALGASSFVIDCQLAEDGEVYARVAELEAA